MYDKTSVTGFEIPDQVKSSVGSPVVVVGSTISGNKEGNFVIGSNRREGNTDTVAQYLFVLVLLLNFDGHCLVRIFVLLLGLPTMGHGIS